LYALFTRRKVVVISSELTDKRLCELIKESDEKALKDLFYRYSDQLRLFCFRRTQSQDLASDIVQEVFMRLWQNRDTLDQNLSIKAYLYRCSQNNLIDYFRKKNTQQKFLEGNPSTNLYTQIDETFDVEESIRDALQKLPVELRIVFLMSRFDGLKNKEIAESLEISIKTVESRMTKALKHLHKLLEHLLIVATYLTYTADYIKRFFNNWVG
jgi:RNA polymerase sigma-70 factor (ECF subfamily)